jgi:hypothetical protein
MIDPTNIDFDTINSNPNNKNRITSILVTLGAICLTIGLANFYFNNKSYENKG